jgi:hypothetical protein
MQDASMDAVRTYLIRKGCDIVHELASSEHTHAFDIVLPSGNPRTLYVGWNRIRNYRPEDVERELDQMNIIRQLELSSTSASISDRPTQR